MDQKEIKEIIVNNKKYNITKIVGMWFFCLEGSNDTGWTACSEGFVKLIENTA